MRRAFALAVVAALAVAGRAHAQEACTGLAGLHQPGMTITRAEPVASVAAFAPDLATSAGGDPLCRVDGYLSPTPDSHIGFEVWLPAPARWNHKLHAVGNGGLLGALNRKAMAPGLRRGYATMTTDLGHLNQPPGTPEDPSWAPGHPDRIVDYAYRGEHLATLAAKQVIARYYGRAPTHAFYTGCSAGGIMGLSELLRYPHDYDGYIVGAATPDHLGQEAGAMWNTLAASLADPANAILPAQAAALHAAVLRACGGRDGGAPGDAFLTDPQMCAFDPHTLACRPGEAAQICLSPAQVAIVERIHGGPVNPRTGAQLFSGLDWGTELGWQRFFLGKTNPVGTDRPWAGFMALMAYDDPTWLTRERYLTFDFDRDLTEVRARRVGGETLDSSWNVRNRNLDEFAAAGGRIIQFHGWDDPNIPALEAVRFQRELVADTMARHHLGEAAAQAQVARYHRLFMLPGVGHCAGGPGADSFGQGGDPAGPAPDQDALGALERWVENGVAPSRLIAVRKGEPAPREGEAGAPMPATVRTGPPSSRPICAWPASAHWDGKGDPHVAASFSCKMTASPGKTAAR